MNDLIKQLKEYYPKYTKIRLIKMHDYQAHQTQFGYVKSIDDIGTIHMLWQNGSSLGLVFGKDRFEVVKKPRKTMAHIKSLNGVMDEIIVIEEQDNNHIIVDYKGTLCRAIYNIFSGAYYADDVYSKIEVKELWKI